MEQEPKRIKPLSFAQRYDPVSIKKQIWIRLGWYCFILLAEIAFYVLFFVTKRNDSIRNLIWNMILLVVLRLSNQVISFLRKSIKELMEEYLEPPEDKFIKIVKRCLKSANIVSFASIAVFIIMLVILYI